MGYSIRGKRPLLVATLTAIASVCFIMLPAIALSQLANQLGANDSHELHTSVPVHIGLNSKTAQIKLRDANLNICVLASRHDLAFEPGTITQTPQGGEGVDCGTVI